MEMFSDRICSVCCIIIISCFTDAKVTVYLIYQKENAIFLLSAHTIYQNESRMATPGTPVSEKCVHRHVCAPGHARQKVSGITRSVSRHPFGEEGYTSSPASRDMDRRDAGYGRSSPSISRVKPEDMCPRRHVCPEEKELTSASGGIMLLPHAYGRFGVKIDTIHTGGARLPPPRCGDASPGRGACSRR